MSHQLKKKSGEFAIKNQNKYSQLEDEMNGHIESLNDSQQVVTASLLSRPGD